MRNKKEIIDRWGGVLPGRIDDLTWTKEYCANKEKNLKGTYSSFLSKNHADVGILSYILNHDIAAFKENLTQAAKVYGELYTRYDAGEPIDPTYVTMKGMIKLLDVLAAGDIDAAIEYSKLLGGRRDEERYNTYTQLWEAIGYPVKFILEGYEIIQHPVSGRDKMHYLGSSPREMPNWGWIEILHSICSKEHPAMLGLSDVLNGIVRDDIKLITQGFDSLLKNHHKECGEQIMQELFQGPDQDLFVWGIGLANLCRYKGFDVKFDNPLIPNDLLIPVFVNSSG